MKRSFILAAAMTLIAASGARSDVSVASQDLNKDGKVTFEEFVESHDAGIARNDAFIKRHRAVFDSADTNGDGVVDAAESQGGKAKKKAGMKKS